MSSTGFTSPFGANSNPFGRPDAGSMQRVAEEEEGEMIASPTTPSFHPASSAANAFRSPFGADASGDIPMSGHNWPSAADAFPPQYNFGRRTSVSAESLKPNADTYDNWTPPVHPKTQAQLDRLKQAISSNFLFSHLDDEQSSQVLGALVEKPIPTKGIKVSVNIVLAKYSIF